MESSAVFRVSVGMIVLLWVSSPTDAISCYNYTCASGLDPYPPCAASFDASGKSKCNGALCLLQWLTIWKTNGSETVFLLNTTTRTCVDPQTSRLIPLKTLDDCVGLSQTNKNYSQYRFFVYENQCCYDADYSGTGNTVLCLCLTDNCNGNVSKPKGPSKPKSSASGIGINGTGFYLRMLLVSVAPVLVVDGWRRLLEINL